MFIEIQNVNIVQTKMLGWMQTNLDHSTKEKLAVFIEEELGQYIAAAPEDTATPVLPYSVIAELGNPSVPEPIEVRASENV